MIKPRDSVREASGSNTRETLYLLNIDKMHLLNVSPKMLQQNGGVEIQNHCYLLESSVADDRYKLFKIYTTFNIPLVTTRVISLPAQQPDSREAGAPLLAAPLQSPVVDLSK